MGAVRLISVTAILLIWYIMLLVEVLVLVRCGHTIDQVWCWFKFKHAIGIFTVRCSKIVLIERGQIQAIEPYEYSLKT